MNPQAFFESHKDAIIKAFSDFNILELPAGYIGELNESIELLRKHDLSLNEKNILSYVKAKAAIMSFFRNNEPELLEKCSRKETENRAAGIVIPEWLVASAIMIGLFVDLVTLGKFIQSVLHERFPSEESQKIIQVADSIVNIKEVKEFNLEINKEKKT